MECLELTVHHLNFLQHGFSKDTLRELLFAILQLLRENKKPSLFFMMIVDSILEEFADTVEADGYVVDTDVRTVYEGNNTLESHLPVLHVSGNFCQLLKKKEKSFSSIKIKNAPRFVVEVL